MIHTKETALAKAGELLAALGLLRLDTAGLALRDKMERDVAAAILEAQAEALDQVIGSDSWDSPIIGGELIRVVADRLRREAAELREG